MCNNTKKKLEINGNLLTLSNRGHRCLPIKLIIRLIPAIFIDHSENFYLFKFGVV